MNNAQPLPVLALLVFVSTFLSINAFDLHAQVLEPGCLCWGANGHFDQGGAYANLSVANQVSDLQDMFGSAHGAVLYRCSDFDNTGFVNQTNQLVQAGIVPIGLILTYPDWSGATFNSETSAYNWAYNKTKILVQTYSMIKLWEIGNEWDLHNGFLTASQNTTSAADQSKYRVATNGKGQQIYPWARGITAGCVAAIRDFGPAGSQIIGGSTSGWVHIAFAAALGQDLVSPYNVPGGGTRSLLWDFTALHWYQDVSGNMFGTDPANFHGGQNAFLILKKACGKPIVVTELGSATGNVQSNEAAAGTNITAMMQSFVNNQNVSSTSPGIAGACIYQLYQQPSNIDPGWYLYRYSSGSINGGIGAQGEAVKNWIASYPSCGGTSVGSVQDEKNNSISVYPNPFRTMATIKTNSGSILQNAELEIYDMLGQVVKRINSVSGQNIIIDRANLSAGVYFYKLTEGNKIVATGKLVAE